MDPAAIKAWAPIVITAISVLAAALGNERLQSTDLTVTEAKAVAGVAEVKVEGVFVDYREFIVEDAKVHAGCDAALESLVRHPEDIEHVVGKCHSEGVIE